MQLRYLKDIIIWNIICLIWSNELWMLILTAQIWELYVMSSLICSLRRGVNAEVVGAIVQSSGEIINKRTLTCIFSWNWMNLMLRWRLILWVWILFLVLERFSHLFYKKKDRDLLLLLPEMFILLRLVSRLGCSQMLPSLVLGDLGINCFVLNVVKSITLLINVFSCTVFLQVLAEVEVARPPDSVGAWTILLHNVVQSATCIFSTTTIECWWMFSFTIACSLHSSYHSHSTHSTYNRS